MESKFDQLVTIFNASPVSTDALHEIILLLQQQTTESLPSFVSQSFQSLLILKCWSWQLFTEDFHQWINQPYYQDFFHTFASVNKKIIYHYDSITLDTKVSLLFPDTIDQVNSIFKQIQQNQDDNDVFITIVSYWFDNHAHFLYDNPQYTISSVIDHIGQYIVCNYFMNKQYKNYLNQLRQPELSESIFTPKMLFYIKTCSFYTYAYLGVKVYDFPYTADEMLEYISDDYLKMIHVHNYTVSSWNTKLLGCIAHLVGLVFACCWWHGEMQGQIKIIFPTEQIICDHVQDLIRIVGHEIIYKQTTSIRSNDETFLMSSAFMFLIIIVQTQNINWLFRSNTTIRDTIVLAGNASLNDEICLCGYVILGEALADEDLKDIKIAGNISNYFLTLLEDTWHHPSKTHRQIPILYMLKGFQTLAKNDSMQERTFQLGKIQLFIEMCDQYPIAYDIIWALSFNPDIQQHLRCNSSFISKLTHLAKECQNEQIKKAMHGILWNLEINHEDRPTVEINDKKSFDIMISYSHKDAELCKQIYKELTNAGYRVWIDFDHMHGNVMDAMANAIESSHTVIICMSESYRKSNYCRAEAHYAFQRERKIVPVLLQKHYKPDGWLLFLIGQLLYVNFNKHEFNTAMEMLFKEVKEKDIAEANISSDHPKEDTHDISPVLSSKVSVPSTLSQNIPEWTKTQVHDWLFEQKLNQMSRLLADCDGGSLIYLVKCIKHGDLRCILNSLQEDCLRRTNENLSYIELSCFLSLMDRQVIT